MTDETAENAEGLARLVAATYRLSQILRIPIEDATALMLKFSSAAGAIDKRRKSLS